MSPWSPMATTAHNAHWTPTATITRTPRHQPNEAPKAATMPLTTTILVTHNNSPPSPKHGNTTSPTKPPTPPVMGLTTTTTTTTLTAAPLPLNDHKWQGVPMPPPTNDGGLYSPPWVPADSAGFPGKSEFHEISMESIWLEPQPFGVPFPWKFPLFSKEFRWKWLESHGLHWNSTKIPLEFHWKQHYSHCQK